MKLEYVRDDWPTQDMRWLRSSHGTDATQGVMLDLTDSDWVAGTHWPDLYLLSGIIVIEIAAKLGFWKPYIAGTDPTTQGTGRLIYNGTTEKINVTLNPEISVALLTHGSIRKQYLPVHSAITDAQFAVLLPGVELSLGESS